MVIGQVAFLQGTKNQVCVDLVFTFLDRFFYWSERGSPVHIGKNNSLLGSTISCNTTCLLDQLTTVPNRKNKKHTTSFISSFL